MQDLQPDPGSLQTENQQLKQKNWELSSEISKLSEFEITTKKYIKSQKKQVMAIRHFIVNLMAQNENIAQDHGTVRTLTISKVQLQ